MRNEEVTIISACRRFLFVFVFLLMLLNLGCFEYEEKIVMNADGSGQLFIHYQAERDMKFETLYFPTDGYEVDYNIKKNFMADGLTNQSYDVLQKQKLTHVYMDFNFEDLNSLNSAPRFQNEEFERSENDHLITLQRFVYFDEDKLDRTKLLFKSGLKSLFNRRVLSDIHFRFQWIVPGEIVAANASLIGNKNRAIWITTLAELLKNRSTQFVLTYKPEKENQEFRP